MKIYCSTDICFYEANGAMKVGLAKNRCGTVMTSQDSLDSTRLIIP